MEVAFDGNYLGVKIVKKKNVIKAPSRAGLHVIQFLCEDNLSET